MRKQPKLWDSQRGRRKKERENFAAKSSNLRHWWACAQNQGLSEYQRRASGLWTSPSSTGGIEAGGRQPESARGKLGPRDGILYPTVSRLPIANPVFLGSWTVDVCQEGHSQRSAPQRRHTTLLRQRSRCAPVGPGR